MKILFVLKQRHFARPFLGTIRELARRGHIVRVLWQGDLGPDTDPVRRELDGMAGVSVDVIDGRRSVAMREVAILRRFSNYLWYLDPPYRSATKLRTRAFSKLLRAALESDSEVSPDWGEVGLALKGRELRRLKSVMRYVESVLPTDPACDEILTRERPDVLLVPPLVNLSSTMQVEFAKSARALGIPVALPVYSWDNLSTKGGMPVPPDRVFVWNKRQRREAKDLHGIPYGRVELTGAPRFDAFFACEPGISREGFCEPLGLDPARPIVAYVCSSEFIADRELRYVQRWLAGLRASPDPLLRDAGVFVRPHPDLPLLQDDVPATKVTWPGVEGVIGTVQRPFDDPRAIVLNTTSVTPQGLYECLHHSAAVVGLNTSAEIEAGILGKPVFTVLADDESASGQRQTLHFDYLLKSAGGFVELASSLDEHYAQLAAALALGGASAPGIKKLAKRFVRPLGWSLPASTLLADAIERMGGGPGTR